MRSACDLVSCCCLACDVTAYDAKSPAIVSSDASHQATVFTKILSALAPRPFTSSRDPASRAEESKPAPAQKVKKSLQGSLQEVPADPPKRGNNEFSGDSASQRSWFPCREYKIPPPRKSRKITQKLQCGPPRDRPENYRKITKKLQAYRKFTRKLRF